MQDWKAHCAFATLGNAIVVHQLAAPEFAEAERCSHLEDAQPDWPSILLAPELVELIITHVNAKVARATCKLWNRLSPSLTGQHARDLAAMHHTGETNAVQTVHVSEHDSADVRCMAVLARRILCVGDANGLIIMWRLDDDGNADDRIGCLRFHQLRHGVDGEGHVESLLAEGDILISVGYDGGGRGTATWVTRLVEGALELLEQDDLGDPIRTDEPNEDDSGSSAADDEVRIAKYVRSVPLVMPFEQGGTMPATQAYAGMG